MSTVSCWVVFANFLVITFVNWPRQQQFPPKWPPTLQHLRSEDTRLDRGRVMAAALSMQIYQTRYMETDSDPCKNWIASKTFRFKYQKDTLKLNLSWTLNLCNCSRCVGRGCKEQCRTLDHLEIVVAADISFQRRRAGAGAGTGRGRGTWRGMGRG